jgi:hypothetical protein
MKGEEFFPQAEWEKLSVKDQNYFWDMSAEDLVARWETPFGKSLLSVILARNLDQTNQNPYDGIVGTVMNAFKQKPKYDLRGVKLTNFSNTSENEILPFNFNNCHLEYSNFSGSDFDNSDFSNSHILYSNFSGCMLRDCNFKNCNLTLTRFDDSDFEEANFCGSWLSNASFEDCDLAYVKFNRKTDFYNLAIDNASGTSNPLFVSYVKRVQYLKHFKAQSLKNKLVYYLWLVVSDCGNSFLRWALTALAIWAAFGFLYSNLLRSSLYVANGRHLTRWSYYYFSGVVFTTLGFGDIAPNSGIAETAVLMEVVLGYVMLGGLISIMATKLVPSR